MTPVIIPFYKNYAQLSKCLSHLRLQSAPVEIFVRDNSQDNILFTAAVNEGIMRFLNADGDYLVILNQDMYLNADAIEKMVDFMNGNPRCGIGAPLQIHPLDKDYVIWGGGFDAFPAGRHQHGHIRHFGKSAQIFWANGACMILRKRMIREIGLLDKNLRFIGSDSDYSFTARARGWEIWRIADASGVHEHGSSGVSSNPEVELIKIRDMLYFASKWLTGGLYNAMAFEGPRISADTIEKIITALQAAEIRISARTPEHFNGFDADSSFIARATG